MTNLLRNLLWFNHSRERIVWVIAPCLCWDEVRIVDDGHVGEEDEKDPVEPEEEVDDCSRSCPGCFSVIPAEILVEAVEKGLHVIVTPGKSLKATFGKVLIFPGEVLGTNESWREWVSRFSHAELDRAASNRFLHSLKLCCLQKDEDESKNEGNSTEVPVGHRIAKFSLLIKEEQAEESRCWASYKDEGEPVVECQLWGEDVVERHDCHEETISPYAVLEV